MKEINNPIPLKSLKHQNLLSFLEYAAIATTCLGAILSIVYKSGIYLSFLLSAVLFLNLVNQKRHEQFLRSHINKIEIQLADKFSNIQRYLDIQPSLWKEEQQLSSDIKKNFESLICSQFSNINQELTKLIPIAAEVNRIQDEICQLRFDHQKALSLFSNDISTQRANLAQIDHSELLKQQFSIMIAVLEDRFESIESRLKKILEKPDTNTNLIHQIESHINEKVENLQSLINQLKIEKSNVISSNSATLSELGKEVEKMQDYLDQISLAFSTIENSISPIETISRNQASIHLNLCAKFLNGIKPLIEEWREDNSDKLQNHISSKESILLSGDINPIDIREDSSLKEFADTSPSSIGRSLQNGC